VNETELSALCLVTATTTLEAQWIQKRRLFPDSALPGLAGLFERRNLSEEDLIIGLASNVDQFRPRIDVVSEGTGLARSAGIDFDREEMERLLDLGRAEIYGMVNERLSNFARTGRNRRSTHRPLVMRCRSSPLFLS
jgi:hypothetical protein